MRSHAIRAGGLLIVVLMVWLSRPTAQAPVEERILVMPFENETRSGRAFWLGEASAVLLGDELGVLGASAIERHERREAFDRLQVPPAAVLTDATVIRIAQLVGATEAIVGSFRLEREHLHVRARSVAIETGRLRRHASADGPLLELFSVFERLARSLRPGRIDATRRAFLPPRPDIGAFENYIKGLVADVPATATTYLRAALAAEPTFDRARLALWDVYADQEDHRQAAQEVARVAPDSPLSPRARFRLGLSQLHLGQHDEAFDTFSALSAVRRAPAVLNNLGVAQLRRGAGARGPSASEWFEQASDADPSEPDFFFNLGYAHWLQRDAAAAIQALRQVVRRSPSDGEAHYLLGTALGLAGQPAEAARERELAHRLSSVFAEWDRRPAGETVPKGLERIKPDVALPHRHRIEATVTDRRNQQELATFYLERAARSYAQEQDRQALAEVSRALFLSPYDAEAHLLAGRIHLRAGRVSEAIDAFKIATWSRPSAAAHAALAAAYLELKDADGAREEAKRALALDPAHPEAQRALQHAERKDR